MSLSSNLTQRRLIEKYTKTGSFEHNYQSQTTVWTDALVALLELHAIQHIPCQEWDIPSLSEHAKQLIKNQVNISENKRTPVDILLPSLVDSSETSSLRYCCEFVETDAGLTRVGFFQKLEKNEQSTPQQERIQIALNANTTGTWEYFVVSNELYWDKTMHALFEKPRSSIPLRFSDWLKLFSPASQDDFIEDFELINRPSNHDELIDRKFSFTTPSNKQKYVCLNARFYRNELDKIVRIVGTCTDITESELCKQNVLTLATDAQKYEMMAEDAKAARARFIANISHELRTPLNAIMGALQILQSFNFNDDIQSILDMANTSSNELLDTINDVLDLSKADSNKLDIDQVDLNITQLLENSVEKYRSELNEMTEIKISVLEKFENMRLGDPLRFNQVINNLISNAVKYTLKGEIEVVLCGDEGSVEVIVRDTGIGIAPENLQLIFEAFRQTDESTTRQFSGVGLGLAICDKIVKLMGGSIVATSRLGKGSEFHLTLPMPVIGEHVRHLGDNRLSDAVPNLSHQHILYAEDNENNVKIVQQLLRPTEAILELAIDGKQVLALYRKSKSVTMIVLDVEIPLIDGLQVCERIRQENKTIPIIALTSKVSKEDQKKYFNAGFTDIIEKPIMFDNFYDVIASN